MSLETSSHFPEHTFRLTVSFALLSRSWSSLHNQILEKLDRTEKQLEVIKAENRQLMDMVKQLLHRAPKRRKVLVQFLINTHSCDEQLRMTASTFLTSELLLSVCCVHWNKTLKRFLNGAVLTFLCSTNLSVVFQVNLQVFPFRSCCLSRSLNTCVSSSSVFSFELLVFVRCPSLLRW